jgi:hypothetical protein
MMRSFAAGLLLGLSVSAASAQDLLREFSWSELQRDGRLPAGQLLPSNSSTPGEQLRIENPWGKPRTVRLLDLKNPGVTSLRYVVEGSIRYRDVKATSYLEMWSWFANGGAYFSRTLGGSEPMGSIEGSSDWRACALPFVSDPKTGPPTRIAVNMVFGGGGTVDLRPMKLLEYRDGWWSDAAAGWIGGIGGSVVGLLGAIVGTLAGIGKARRFVLALMAAVALAGVASLLAGLVAVGMRQPYAVYYPLLLGGVLSTAIFGGQIPMVRRRYQQIELRKMAALDAR